ncbi:hypothetical protein [Acinetobacter baumannii]|uniref:hypothetical protein n=1 Tax=Acinetobacter baumannii TaxID=470 RepID=UPI00044968D6|nr:hypothetical protein [Acinetobacter baumannii]EXR21482.1 hypothetical protein J669_1814 [Acinetobacter baumannii 1295549]EXR92971.1 hypothetical protein J680_0448 [Acinetobacter baumannii 277047]EXS39869.1 hypothetical protein J677_0629 [Acinetobacter baumannii 426863]
MDNYKIKVKDEAESKEAQELFFALRAKRADGTTNVWLSPTVYGLLVWDGLLNYVFADSGFNDSNAKELTLPQLRDLVAQAKKFITSDHLNRFEAAEAHLEGHPVQFMLANGDFIDITSDTTLGIFEKDGGYSFRIKPTTLTVNAELPKPNKETQHNSLVYAVTYEFKTREERNAFADKLRGTNS